MATTVPNDIVLYHYKYSPYARRVVWYLQLRGIAYSECPQPNAIPRPDLNALGVNYRRIPVLAIGRDVYCDTRLILRRLEEKFSDGKLGAAKPEQLGIQKLLERFIGDGGIFARASQLIPLDSPILKDEKFRKDRAEMTGRSWSPETIKKGRPEALVHIKDAFNLLETTFFGDGREWILNTEKPSLADLEAIFPFHWLDEMKGALPSSFREDFPKVFAWIDRFNRTMAAIEKDAPKPVRLQGAQAAVHVLSGDVVNEDGHVDSSDPIELQKGSQVEVWPLDSGSSHHDVGTLVTLTPDEVVLAVQPAASKAKPVHVHMPRWGFRVRQAKEASL